MKSLNCDDIRETLASGATLLDVRTPEEYRSGALPNAKNIPLSILPVIAHEQLDREEPVLIYCRSGARAIMAQKILNSLGFEEVVNIGGVDQYRHCH